MNVGGQDRVRPAWRHAERDRNDRVIFDRRRRCNKRKRNPLPGEFRPARMAQRLGDCLHEGPGEIARGVKMRSTRGWTKRPCEALLQLALGYTLRLFSVGGRGPT